GSTAPPAPMDPALTLRGTAHAKRLKVRSLTAAVDVCRPPGIIAFSPWTAGRFLQMHSALIAGLAVACMVGGALLGFALQRRLPAHHLSKESQDLIKVCAGVIATVTALVLGLLVSSSKASFDKMNSRVVEFGAKAIMLDTMLARLGPEAKPAREELRRSV